MFPKINECNSLYWKIKIKNYSKKNIIFLLRIKTPTYNEHVLNCRLKSANIESTNQSCHLYLHLCHS